MSRKATRTIDILTTILLWIVVLFMFGFWWSLLWLMFYGFIRLIRVLFFGPLYGDGVNYE